MAIVRVCLITFGAPTWRLFHVRYTLRGTSYPLRWIGFSRQVPAHRATERDAAIAA